MRCKPIDMIRKDIFIFRLFFTLMMVASVAVQVHAQDAAYTDTIYEKSWMQKTVERLDSLMDHPLLKTSQLAMMVYDLTADSVVYTHNERQLMRPASTMKVITAVAALDRLGSNHRFRTTMRIDGSIRDSVLHGNITFKGSLDPMFSSVDMQKFVAYLQNKGIKTVDGDAIADKSMKDTLRFGEGWCWDDDNPVLDPLLVDGKDGFVDKFRTVWLAGKASGKGTTAVSHGLCDVMKPMMKDSENLYAEAVFYQLAASVAAGRPATARHARAAIREVVKKMGKSPENYRFADGSGLSLYNYVSAELLTSFLRYAYGKKEIYKHLEQLLPIAGKDGTLKKRMRKSPCEGNVRAKTGTLTGIISLAGYCTASNGHKLAFTIINQGVLTNKPARDFQDQVCGVLCSQ